MLEAEPQAVRDVYRGKVRSVSYFASDLSAEEHLLKSIRVHRFFSRSQGVVFFSDKDAALKVSKHVHLGLERAGQKSSGLTYCDIGEGGRVVQKTVIPSVDASCLGPNLEDILGHSYILRSPTLKSHLEHLIFGAPFSYEARYRKLNPPIPAALGGVSIKAILDCSDESWVLEEKK